MGKSIIITPKTMLLLGHPWLEDHNPNTDWSAGRIVNWISSFYSSCLLFTSSPAEGTITSSSPSSETLDLSSIPAEYHDLGEFFSKDHALSSASS